MYRHWPGAKLQQFRASDLPAAGAEAALQLLWKAGVIEAGES